MNPGNESVRDAGSRGGNARKSRSPWACLHGIGKAICVHLRSSAVPNITSRDFESAAQPVRGAAVESDHVEAAGGLAREAREELPRGGGDARALARVDALCGAAEALARAQAHLDEDQRLAVARDEVDLAQPRAVIARHDGAPVVGQQ